MKTTKEMIEVMQAYERGERIEVHYLYDTKDYWISCGTPVWDWDNFDYRVKQNKKYVPFDTPEEFFAAQRVHGYRLISTDDGVLTDDISPRAHDISITLDGHVFEHIEGNRNSDCSYLGDLKDIFEDYKFIDGTQCGKEVEV